MGPLVAEICAQIEKQTDMLITQYSTPLQRQVTEQHSRRGKLRDWPGSHETVSEQGAITLLKTNQAAIDELVVTTASIWPMHQYTAQLSYNEPHTDTHTHGHRHTQWHRYDRHIQQLCARWDSASLHSWQSGRPNSVRCLGSNSRNN